MRVSRHDCVVGKLESRNVLHLRETPHMYDTTLIFTALSAGPMLAKTAHKGPPYQLHGVTLLCFAPLHRTCRGRILLCCVNFLAQVSTQPHVRSTVVIISNHSALILLPSFVKPVNCEVPGCCQHHLSKAGQKVEQHICVLPCTGITPPDVDEHIIFEGYK